MKQEALKGINRRKFLKYSIHSMLATGLSSNILFSACGKQYPAKRPNILFIVIDALRADRLGCYGHPGGFSPTIDEIAAESVVFDQAISQAPWTQPSIASVFCSSYPTIHKINSVQLVTSMELGRKKKIAVFEKALTLITPAFNTPGLGRTRTCKGVV